MQTSIADFIKDTSHGKEAEAILRTCVHCGFCLATCPTYLMLGDELDSPRGRIYLMKQVMEGNEVTAKTQLHLDRCLTCRNCETTCPSGVQYGHLVDIGREVVEQKVPRDLRQRVMRWGLRNVLPRRALFTPMLRLGQLVRPLLPSSIRRSIPPRQLAGSWPELRHDRRMLVLEGCVQPGLAPNINAATARVLDRLGVSLIRETGETCCGAVSFHLNAHEDAKDAMRRNINAWWPHVEAGAEAIIMTASGCGVMVKDYGHVLRDDAQYADKAARVSALTKDLCEILNGEDIGALGLGEASPTKVAFHPPCTLQHGQKLQGVAERILRNVGFTLTPIPDAHLCCGSAGTYSILQKDLSERLLKNKLTAIIGGNPDIIATANIGCLLHLQQGAAVPVKHWIELLDRQLQ